MVVKVLLLLKWTFKMQSKSVSVNRVHIGRLAGNIRSTASSRKWPTTRLPADRPPPTRTWTECGMLSECACSASRSSARAGIIPLWRASATQAPWVSTTAPTTAAVRYRGTSHRESRSAPTLSSLNCDPPTTCRPRTTARRRRQTATFTPTGRHSTAPTMLRSDS